ncbi:MAG: SAM-dependent chlorinase/fluorinase [Pseudomonadota bacterium]
MKRSGIITLLTDFGLRDPYVGIMKGVILSIHPGARIVDLSHQVGAGDIFQAAILLQESFSFFPSGSVHVAVVDPGVGGDRRPITVKTEDHFFVGPDNGLFWPVITGHEKKEVIHLTERKYFLSRVSDTFHGRDIFASAAAHLSLGVDPGEMGVVINDPVPLLIPQPIERGDILTGQIMRVDRFGNLITNIYRKRLDVFLGGKSPTFRVGSLVIEGLSRSYTGAKAGQFLALMGSSDCLEIAVNLGRACDRLGINEEKMVGAEVKVIKPC